MLRTLPSAIDCADTTRSTWDLRCCLPTRSVTSSSPPGMTTLMPRPHAKASPCFDRGGAGALLLHLHAGAGDEDGKRGHHQRGRQRPEHRRVAAQAQQEQGGADGTDRAGAVGAERDGAADGAVVTRAE